MTGITPINAPTGFAYRPDIDGLRAVAVLAVVLFHLGFAQLEGGFLGVDIFFVISGYLITSIITPKVVAGHFSFRDFYLKRIRRLIPPALVTVALTFVTSAFILDPTDLLAMAKSAIASVFSVSNILFFTEAGYWDAQSELKPLLHTWSLGVEEQFYLFWPLLVFLLWRVIPQRKFVLAFAIITLIGIAVSEWMLRLNPSAAFFLLPARVFEFSIGACFAFIGKTALWTRIGNMALRSILGWASLLIILSTIWIYKGDTPFPGLNGVLPCLATALLLLCGTGIKPIPVLNALLSNSLMNWIGRLSYSLYLVHWPVLALMRYKVGLELHLHHQIIAAVIMGILALLLYYGVESRISARAGQSSKSSKDAPEKPVRHGRFAIGTGMVALALTAIFSHAILNSGWTWRFPTLTFTPEQLAAIKKDRFKIKKELCEFSNFPNGARCDTAKPIRVLVIGDSHEWDGINFLYGGYGQSQDVEIVRFGQLNRCKKKKLKNGEFILDDPKCQARADRLMTSEIAKHINIIAYSAHKPFAPNEIITFKIIEKVKSLNKDTKLIVFGSYIVTEKPCPQIVNETGDMSACIKYATRWPTMDSEGPLYENFKSLTDIFIDRGKLLCSGEQPQTCEGQTPDGELMMIDTNHMSFKFSQYAGRKYAKGNPNLLKDLVK